jgi:superfamily II DNA or RNA helicase
VFESGKDMAKPSYGRHPGFANAAPAPTGAKAQTSSDPWALFDSPETRAAPQRLVYGLVRDAQDARRLVVTMEYRPGQPVRAMPYELGEEERVVVAGVSSMPRRQGDSVFQPKGDLGRRGVSALLAGFAVHGPGGVPLELGDPIEGLDFWESDDQGRQTFRLMLGTQRQIVDAGGPWLLDGNVLHPIDTKLDPQDAVELVFAGTLDPERSSAIRARLASRGAAVPQSALPAAVRTNRYRVAPKPVMTLDRDQDGPVSRVTAEYDGIPADSINDAGEVRRYDPATATLAVIERDQAAEERILEDAAAHGYDMFASTEEWFAPGDAADPESRDVDAALHDARVRPAMEASGWTVREGPRWNLTLRTISRLELDVAVGADGPGGYLLDVLGDGRTVEFIDPLTDIARSIPLDAEEDEIAAILARHVRGEDAAVRASDGRIWIMPAAQFTGLVSSIHRILSAPRGPAGRIAVDAYSLADLAALSRDVGLTAPESLTNLFEAMRSGEARRSDWPACFAGDREDKQLAAASWMRLLFETGYGGILADDIGFGKTIEIGLHVAGLREDGLLKHGALIAVPNNAVGKWRDKLALCFPTLETVVWHGASRPETGAGDIVITSHDLVKRDACPLGHRRWTVLAIDEAQDAKKPNGHLAVACASIEADQKIPVTATPMENGLDDLWSLMNIANQGILGTLPAFRKAVSTPIMKDADVVAANRMNAICAPFILQRLDLDRPKPVVTDVVLEMTQDQRDSYDVVVGQIRKKFEKRIEAAEARGECPQALGMSVLLSMTRVRQLGCSPLLMPGGVRGPVDPYVVSPRTKAIVDSAIDRVRDGKRIIMFSSWTGHLDILSMALKAVGIRCAQYDGRMTRKDKDAAEAAFISHSADVLLMTTKSGGRSLDFNEADCVFLCDPWWNPKTDHQAIGRATRRGQTKTIEVLRFLSANPVEDRIMRINRRKDRLSDLMTPGRVVESCDGITLEDMQAFLTTFAQMDAGLAMAA